MADNSRVGGGMDSAAAMRQLEAQIDTGVRQLVAQIPPDQLGEVMSQLPVLVTQIPQLRYPNLPEAGPLLDKLGRELAEYGAAQDNEQVATQISDRVERTLSEVVVKLTRPEVRQYIRSLLYTTLVQIDPASVEALVLAVGVMTMETMEPGDNPMLKQMVLMTWQEATQEMMALEQAMTNLPTAMQVKPSTRLLLRLGDGPARQLTRTAALASFINYSRVALPPNEVENDAKRVLEIEERIRSEGREDLNDEERGEEQRMAEVTINLRFAPNRIAAVQQEITRLQQWAQQTDPQRFRDLIELTGFAVGSFNMVPPGDHPMLQALWGISINAAASQLMQQQQLDAMAAAGDSADDEEQADERPAS